MKRVTSRMRGVGRLVAVAIAAFLTVPGTARAESQIGGEDWYGSAYGILGIGNTDASGEEPGGGFALSAGFRFNRWLAAEVGGEYLRRIDYDRGTGPVDCAGNGGRQSNYFNAWQVSGGGRVYFFDGIVQPFLLGHGGFIQTRDRGGGKSCSRSGFMARMGGGLEVFVSNDFAVSLLGAYVMPVTGGAKDHDYVSVGLGITWY